MGSEQSKGATHGQLALACAYFCAPAAGSRAPPSTPAEWHGCGLSRTSSGSTAGASGTHPPSVPCCGTSLPASGGRVHAGLRAWAHRFAQEGTRTWAQVLSFLPCAAELAACFHCTEHGRPPSQDKAGSSPWNDNGTFNIAGNKLPTLRSGWKVVAAVAQCCSPDGDECDNRPGQGGAQTRLHRVKRRAGSSSAGTPGHTTRSAGSCAAAG